MLFINGHVFTGKSETAFVDAFRIRGDTFDWVGSTSEAPEPFAGEDIVDLAGATVVPGLLDVHTHPAMLSDLVDWVDCFPPGVDSIESLVAALRTHPHLGRGQDCWITGFGYDESAYPEARTPTRHDLDRVSDSQPVFVRRCDGHSGACNTVALRLASITATTPNPAGAEFGRDTGGEPDGRLIEIAAAETIARLMPPIDRSERIDRIAQLGTQLAGRGIVGVGDLLATVIDEPLSCFRAAQARGWHPQTGLYLAWDHIKDEPPVLTDTERDGRIKIAGVKVFMDGAYSNRTAWTHDPYPDSCDHGMRLTTREDLLAAGDWARRNGVQLAVHAMGDRALDEAIAALADRRPWLGDLPSVRLDHATLVSAERIARIQAATMNFAVISHSIFMFAEHQAYANNLSADQFRVAYPIRSLYHRLRHAALSSDRPATAWADSDNVFVSVQAAVTRRAYNGADIGSHEAITLPQALLLYTSRAADCMGLDRLGRIQNDAEASFVILDRDVFALSAQDIGETQIMQTWVAGQRIFCREAAA